MSVGSLRLITMAGSVIAIGISFNPAQPQSFDRAYKGSMECDQIPTSAGILRTTLTMTVRNGRVIASAPVFDIDGLHLITSAVAAGTLDAGGVFHLGYTISTRDAEFHGNYSGTLTATGGTLTGTQVWTQATGGESVTRTCTGIVFEVEPPKR
jgi:hypothetical protein